MEASQDYYDGDQGEVRRGARPAAEVPAARHVAVHLRLHRRAGQVRDRPARRDGAGPRAPITDEVEVLFIGGGFSALLTAARLRERGVESIRIVERGADVGGTWYWNRYPGAACDVPGLRLPAAAGRDGLRALAPLRQGPGNLRPLPGDREALRPLRAGRVPHHGHLDHLGRYAEKLWLHRAPTAATRCGPGS